MDLVLVTGDSPTDIMVTIFRTSKVSYGQYAVAVRFAGFLGRIRMRLRHCLNSPFLRLVVGSLMEELRLMLFRPNLFCRAASSWHPQV